MAERTESIGIAGTGRVAQALGRLLAEAGQPVSMAGRDLQFQGCVSRVIIAVPDRAIGEVATNLARRLDVRIALHTCGALGPEALAPLAARGTSCGTLHPLQTFAGPHETAALRGIAFAVSGDAAAVDWAESIASLAKGEVLRIRPEARPLYHAAAVMTSNYIVALIDAGQALMERCGVDRVTALRALGPLVRTSVENALSRGPVEALTGPIERGDLETVSAHLAALEAGPARVLDLYRSAGLQTVDVARRGGLDTNRAEKIEALLARA